MCGIHTLLLPPWCDMLLACYLACSKMHPLIKVVRDWKEVEETLSALALRNAQATN